MYKEKCMKKLSQSFANNVKKVFIVFLAHQMRVEAITWNKTQKGENLVYRCTGFHKSNINLYPGVLKFRSRCSFIKEPVGDPRHEK